MEERKLNCLDKFVIVQSMVRVWLNSLTRATVSVSFFFYHVLSSQTKIYNLLIQSSRTHTQTHSNTRE